MLKSEPRFDSVRFERRILIDISSRDTLPQCIKSTGSPCWQPTSAIHFDLNRIESSSKWDHNCTLFQPLSSSCRIIFFLIDQPKRYCVICHPSNRCLHVNLFLNFRFLCQVASNAKDLTTQHSEIQSAHSIITGYALPTRSNDNARV